ncbi:MAG: carboxypeptidase-like regulatory domain-containing protein [bacterium]
MKMTGKNLNLILIALILTSLAAGCNFGFWGEKTGSISGQVLDADNVPIPEAEVKTSPITQTVRSDQNGFFNINDVKEGDYTVTFLKAGYQSKNTTARVESGLSFSCWGSSSNTYIEIHLVLN